MTKKPVLTANTPRKLTYRTNHGSIEYCELTFVNFLSIIHKPMPIIGLWIGGER